MHNDMKKILFAACILWGVISCVHQQKGFTIRGNVSENIQGARVYLITTGEVTDTLSSAIASDSTFLLEGEVEEPCLCALIIDINEPGNETPDFRNKVIKTDFYLENSRIDYRGDINTLPTYYYNPERTGKPIITGSKTEDEQHAFKALIQEENMMIGKLEKRYMDEYHLPSLEGKEVTQEGIDIVREKKTWEEKLRRKTLDYIKKNSQSVVAFDQASYIIQGYSFPVTATEMDSLANWLKQAWKDKERYNKLCQTVEQLRPLAIGEKYLDAEFVNPQGEKVTLSSLIPKGEYCMIEFWASWCGLCRAEIPHLAKVHKRYPQFNIISISLDAKDSDWRKAMKEEGMVWTQLRNPDGMEGVTKDLYHIYAIPTCIILDQEGRFYRNNMRGAYLDEFLDTVFKK